MKRILMLLTILVATCTASNLSANTFQQRYGANSYITNTPLWFEGNYRRKKGVSTRKACRKKDTQKKTNETTVEIEETTSTKAA
ncbi:MAG: hypothetical protein NTX86_03040 [Candidatus Dependentiae bacterium]|nr:hypothetical protein [Candidatus Dependentiae bacterium]